MAGVAGTVAALAAALAIALPAGAASSSGGCVLSGTAAFNPGLSSTAQNFSYGFTGTLTNCQSTDSSAPASGTVEAGQTVTVAGITYQEPIATGNGGCSSSTTAGIAIARWKDGTVTVIKYTTTGAAAAVQLAGTVIPSVTLTQVGGTGTTTIDTTRYNGNAANGQLTFGTTSPQDCLSGLKSASINGLAELN
ncbi:MAG TPA: hypothetical protein VFT42_06055 [Solirubrobacteraceae bacterium]|nr:hypothetical protein [Solirubrobacteraceae bacterium]